MKQPAFLEAFRDTVSDRARTRLSPEQVAASCAELSDKIASQYKADIVIAIATGGLMPGELIARSLGLSLESMIIKRDIRIKRMYNKDRFPIRFALSFYHHFLFHITRPTIAKGVERDLAGTNVLLIDDAFHTGSTADVAAAYLREKDVAAVRTAALSYVASRKPDFSILPQGHYCYPWSKDYVASQP